MIPINQARGRADGRHQELLAAVERHRLIAALPAGPAALRPWAYRPAAI
jgi:hypothetical protein